MCSLTNKAYVTVPFNKKSVKEDRGMVLLSFLGEDTIRPVSRERMIKHV